MPEHLFCTRIVDCEAERMGIEYSLLGLPVGNQVTALYRPRLQEMGISGREILGVMERLQHQALLREIEQLVAEARSGLHGGTAFLDGLRYGLTLAGLMEDPEVKQSWARGEALADQSLQRTPIP